MGLRVEKSYEKDRAETMNQPFLCREQRELIDLRQAIAATIENVGYAVIRGLFDPDAVRKGAGLVYDYANSARHRPSGGVSPMDVRSNISKWSIGGRPFQDWVPRFAVAVYNPLFADDSFQLHEAFRRLIEVRDTIAGRAVLYDQVLLPTHFNACRILIYPAGGGFLGEHHDDRGKSNLPLGEFIEVLLVLRQKGADYRTGGGFVRFNGSIAESDQGTQVGDVIVYNSTTLHGVLDVDPDVSFDPTNLRGRAVAITTIYDNR